VSPRRRSDPPAGPPRPLPPGLRIRPIRPEEDVAELGYLLEGLSLEARERRFFTGAVDLERAIRWAAHPELVDGVGLVAEHGGQIAGHGVLVPIDSTTAEVAFEVAAPWRHRGVAGALLRALDEEARRRGITRLVADVMLRNSDMLAVFREHGPLQETVDGPEVHVVMPLTS
jgi:GNAT superfamily N-acetyltransferase